MCPLPESSGICLSISHENRNGSAVPESDLESMEVMLLVCGVLDRAYVARQELPPTDRLEIFGIQRGEVTVESLLTREATDRYVRRHARSLVPIEGFDAAMRLEYLEKSSPIHVILDNCPDTDVRSRVYAVDDHGKVLRIRDFKVKPRQYGGQSVEIRFSPSIGYRRLIGSFTANPMTWNLDDSSGQKELILQPSEMRTTIISRAPKARVPAFRDAAMPKDVWPWILPVEAGQGRKQYIGVDPSVDLECSPGSCVRIDAKTWEWRP